MKYIFKAFLLNIIVINLAFSTEITGFNFLRTHVGARPAAMAGAFVAIPGDIHNLYFNPAGISAVKQRIATVTYLKHLLDFQAGFIGYSQNIDKHSSFAIGVNYIDYGKFEETDVSGKKLGRTFGANNFIFSASYGRILFPNLMSGVSIKYIRSVIDQYTAAAVALDAGVIYDVPFVQDLNVGFAISNIGAATAAYIDTKEKLPLKFEGGFSKKLAHLPLLLNVSIYKFIDDDFQFKIGGEFSVATGVYLRWGYNSIGRDQQVSGDYDRVAGASIGFGVNWQKYIFDYALSSLGEVGALNRITFSIKL